MALPASGRRVLVRVARLPSPAGTALAVWQGARLLHLAAAPELLAGIAPGDLIEVTLPPSKDISSSIQGAAQPLPVTHLLRVGGPLPGTGWESGDALRWRHPADAVPRLELLRLRAAVLRALRGTLDSQGFIETDTPALVPAPSPEPHFSPLAAGPGWLITSPEFQLKRLLVGGAEAIYRLGPVFRGGEQGRLHAPEFTLLEWYRAGADTRALAEDLLALLRAVAPLAQQWATEFPSAASLAGQSSAASRLNPADLRAPLPQLSVADAFQRHLGMDVRGVTTAEGLRRAAHAAGLHDPLWDAPLRDGPPPGAPDSTFDALFSALWVRLEPHLGSAPLLVVDWPAPVASLARLKPGDPTLAERMELYAGGLELANGFAELTDAAEQRRRFAANLRQRREQGLPALPLDERFLAALDHGLPPSAGMALGVDRLVMLVAGVSDIRLVLPFGPDEV